MGQVAASGKPRRISDVTQEPGYVETPDPMRSELCVPMKIADKVIGVINVESRNVAAFSKDDERLLMTLAGQLATALDRLHSEQAVRQSEIRYRGLFDGVPVGLFRSSPQGQLLDANRHLVEMLGYPDRETFLNSNIGNLYINLEDRRRWIAQIETSGVVQDFEVQVRRYDGEIIWVQHTTRVEFDPDGNALFYEGSVINVTKRRHAEAEIQHLARFPEENPNPVLRVAADGRILFANQAGFPVLETCGCVIGDPLPDKMMKLALDAFEAKKTKNAEIEVGDQVFLFTLAPVVDAGYVNLYGRDITDRYQAEKALRDSEEHFRSLLETAPNAIIVVDEQGIIQRVNSMVGILFGYPLEELYEQPIETLLPHVYRKRHKNYRITYHTNPQSRPMGTALELTALRKDGILFPVEVSLGPLQTEQGMLVIAIVRDVSIRRAAQEEQRKLSSAVEQTADGVLISNPEGVIQYVNPAFVAITGYSEDELIGSTPSIFKTDAHRAEKYTELWTTILKGETYRGIFINRKKNGQLFHIDQTITPLRNPQGEITHFVSTWKDITEKMLAEENIRRRSAHLEALHTVDMAISGSVDLGLTLKVVLEQVKTHLSVDAAAVLLYDSQEERLKFSMQIGFVTDALRYTRLRLGESHAGLVALERRIIAIPDLNHKRTDFLRSPLLRQEKFVSYFGVPLIAKGQIQGVLEIFHRSPFDSDTEWMELLNALSTQAAIAIDNANLFKDLQQSNTELVLAYNSTLEGWAKALELRDEETEGHTRRVTELTLDLAQAMGIRGADLEHIRRGALLHDIGKMGIPDSILLKPGKLTEEEWVIMRQHPVYAYNFLSQIDYLRPALDIPYCHHEKWDGTGYPRGLKGEEIPMSARIFAVIDVWDALSSDRPYRKAWEQERVIEYIHEQTDKHFDPAVVEHFMSIINGNHS